MDVSRYKDIFLNETRENLSLLNQLLVRLEGNPSQPDIIDEIFRSIHTIKGSSATMKYDKIMELAHEIENIFDIWRSGKGRPEPDLIEIIFNALDNLENLIDEVETGNEERSDISSILRRLKVAQSLIKEVGQREGPQAKIKLSPVEQKALEKAEEKGRTAFKIEITLEVNCAFKSVRAYMIFKSLEEWGEIIGSSPARSFIESEDFDVSYELGFEVYFVTEKDQESLQKSLNPIPEVHEVLITPLEVEELPPPKTEEMINKVSAPVGGEVLGPQPRVEKLTPTFKVSSRVQVNIEYLDDLMRLVEELVIYKSRLVQVGSKYNLEELNELLIYVSRLTSNLQDEVMRVRMVPILQIFDRFPRMVRDFAREKGKEIELVIEGREIEVDRTILEQIGDPLIHLIRNSIDHGIEPIVERTAKGKYPRGVIWLRAERTRNEILITVEDDGRGMDPDLLLKVALEKRAITPEEASQLTEEEILMLITIPGVSTAKEVTDVSGRGVGMDIVMAKLRDLGGNLEISSSLGKGSKFTMRLPLTLAIIPAMLIRIGEEVYAISLSHVGEVIDVYKDDIKTVKGQKVILWRGMVVPLLKLSDVFGCQQEERYPLSVVVVEIGNRRGGLIVDSLVDQQEIVIKSLGKILSEVKGFAGVTILGDGSPSLILDIKSLL